MEKSLQFIFIACIVNFWFESVQPNGKTDQYRNLFDSIGSKHVQTKEIDRKILTQEVAQERQTFDRMKKELQTARRKNSEKLFRKIENLAVRKRNVDPDSSGVTVIPEHPIMKKLRPIWKDICEDLINLNVELFMERSVQALNYTCQAMSYSHYMGYRNVYNDILATQFTPFNNGSDVFYSGLKPGLIARNTETTFLLEFMVDGNASLAMAEIEKYKDSFIHGSTPNILGVGINFHFIEAPYGYSKINASIIDRLYCDWEAKLYSDTRELKKVFPPTIVVLDCPHIPREHVPRKYH